MNSPRGADPSLRGARAATFVYFVLCGVLMSTWVVHIPSAETRVGISHAALGSLLVLLGLGAFVGMQVTGRLTDRVGPRIVVPVAGVLNSAALVLPGLARSPWTLAGALLVFGFTGGCLDVSMNAHAVHVEKAYGRPVMSAFHATFSVGGVVAALAAAGAAGVGLGPVATLGASAGLGVVIALASARGLLHGTPTATGNGGQLPVPQRHRPPRRIWALAALALTTMLCEGAANDWSALDLKDALGATAGTAAFGYGVFAAAMTLGRLLADRVAARFGATAVLRVGSATAAAGITITAFAPAVRVAFAGWGLFGLGLSGCIPQLFSAAGHADPAAAGANVSRVAGVGYVGMLAGPAVIGWLTHVVALNHAFLLMTVLCVTTAVAAGVLRTGSGVAPDPEPELTPSTP